LTILDNTSRYLFFTGKGGVGKTSLSAACAVALADGEKSVLLVSTDPASNLDQVLDTRIGLLPTAVTGVPSLFAINIDPEAAADEYRHRVIDPFRGVLPDDAIGKMEEQLAGACTTEIAAFDRFASLIAGGGEGDPFDHVIFDTAPTGHTLRLLNLPAAWDGYLATNTTGTSCVGPVSGLRTQREIYTRAIATLTDPKQTTVVLVTRPEDSSIAEAQRTSSELRDTGMTRQHLVVNAVFTADADGDALAAAVQRRADAAMARMPSDLAALPSDTVPLKAFEPVGIASLRHLLDGDGAPKASTKNLLNELPASDSFIDLADELEAAGHGLVMVMGKGGVGKTTIAAALAVEIARRGVPVHLTTTDPAAHLHFALPEDVPGIRVSRIDPRVETQTYIDHVMQTAGAGLDERGRALLEEDLRSPCTEEIAVFNAFSQMLRESRRSVVVIDTAPTGHTLLLLDATGAYHREIMRKHKTAVRLTTPLMMLQDQALTRILIVALPETTPIQEADALQQDLRRAGIEPYGWILNRSLAVANPSHPLLRARAAAEVPRIARVRRELARRMMILPWSAEDPTGARPLLDLLHAGSRASVL
jgi:arsenite-transporting ATPase